MPAWAIFRPGSRSRSRWLWCCGAAGARRRRMRRARFVNHESSLIFSPEEKNPCAAAGLGRAIAPPAQLYDWGPTVLSAWTASATPLLRARMVDRPLKRHMLKAFRHLTLKIAWTH